MRRIAFFNEHINRTNLEFLRQYINRGNIAAWFYDVKQEKFIFVSKKMAELLEMKQKNAPVNANKIMKQVNFTLPIHLDEIKKGLAATGSMTVSDTITLLNGKTIFVNETMIALTNRKDELGIIVGITEIEESVEPVGQNADIANITHLPDHLDAVFFIKQLVEQDEQKQLSFAIHKINIAQFSKVNQSLGYEAGNEVLREISKRLASFMIRKGRAYHGDGDEWLLLQFPLHYEKDAHEFARKLLDIIQEPLHVNGYDLYLKANIGISLYPRDGVKVEDLLSHARTALKQASDKGPNHIEMYSSGLDIESFKKFQLASDLHKAFDRHELFIEFQPKIDVKTLKVCGAEALVRWKHPVWGNVSPAEFIPLAIENRLNERVAGFVFRAVCKQINAWKEQGISQPRVAINLSPQMFLNPYLLVFIETTLKQYQIDPTHLEIEITEESLFEKTETVLEIAEKLRQLGIRFALDDLGKGYSSLTEIIDFPFDTIKIDRSFISSIETSKERLVFVQSIVDSCKKLGKKTVAEGVETKGQFDLLKQIGCDEIQGFYFSPSIPGDEMAKWFKMERVPVREGNGKAHVERRRYFRTSFPHYLIVQMTIHSIEKTTYH